MTGFKTGKAMNASDERNVEVASARPPNRASSGGEPALGNQLNGMPRSASLVSIVSRRKIEKKLEDRPKKPGFPVPPCSSRE